MKFWERIKRAVKTLADSAGIGREVRSIFDLEGVPAYAQFYNTGILLWKCLYRGLYNPWHVIPAPTVRDENHKRELYRMDLAKASAAELASLVWAEGCGVSVSARGFVDAQGNSRDTLGEFIARVLDENGFDTKMRELVEQAAALGGAALKVWHEDGRIRIGYSMADQFVPTAWDNAEVTEGVFVSRVAKGGFYYTRLEWHARDGSVYRIRNDLYKAAMRDAGGSDQDILGIRCPLAEMYPLLSEEVEIRELEKSLFTYFRMPAANNLDDNSPLGISIYANALSTLHAIDICYDSLVREFRLGRKRLIVPAAAIRTVVDPETGAMRRYFDDTDEALQAFSTDEPEAMRIQDNSVEIRVEEHVAALNALLAIYAMQIGVSPGTFSFDVASGLKTATEVVSENSKTYKTVRTVQNRIRPAIEHLIRDILAVASLYGVTYSGRPVAELAKGGYDISVTFDDSIIQDRRTNIDEGILLIGSGLLSKYKFLTDKKYGQGLTPAEAEAELRRIARESRIDAAALEKLTAVTGDGG